MLKPQNQSVMQMFGSGDGQQQDHNKLSVNLPQGGSASMQQLMTQKQVVAHEQQQMMMFSAGEIRGGAGSKNQQVMNNSVQSNLHSVQKANGQISLGSSIHNML